MECPVCGAPLESGTLACATCGTRLAAPCPGCGAVVATGRRFCTACGRRLETPPAPEARDADHARERRGGPAEGTDAAWADVDDDADRTRALTSDGSPRAGAESARKGDGNDRTWALPGSSLPAAGAGGVADHTRPLPSDGLPVASVRAAGPVSFAGGRYQAARLLGEGGNKRVYLAHDTKLDRDVAVALLKVRAGDGAMLDRVRREAQAMARLGDHAHIVTIYDIGEEEGQPFLVTQFMAGGDLETLLERSEQGRLPLDEALRVADQVCQALEYAHVHGIVHRDLKPGNVWLTAGGTCKLGDFGLALFTDRPRLTQENIVAGTVLYMAPEQAEGLPLDARADLYALGVMLYAMVTGRLPFMGPTAARMLYHHVHTAPEPPSRHMPGLPPALDALILGMLAKRPEERPASASRVRQALAALSQRPVAPPSRAPEPTTMPELTRAPNLLDRIAGGAFVGRAAEMALLRAALDEALAGRRAGSVPGVVLLAAEAGIGKTRLAEEFAAQARASGAQVLWGRCYEAEGAPAFWPWIQVLRTYAHDLDAQRLRSLLGSGAAVIAQLVSEVRDLLPELPAPPPSLEAEDARFRLFDSVTTFLRGVAERRPLVLILEDLHWADRSSLLLLQFLARELRGSRLLMLGTYRDVETERDHPLAQTLGLLTRERLVERVHLAGLGPAEVTALLESMMRQQLDACGAALAESLHRETEGNPFFIEEILRHLVETGVLYRRDGRWECGAASVAELGLPEGVRDVIGRRLAGLSDVANRALATAAAVGRDFDLDVLERVTATNPSLGEDRLLDALDEAVAAHVIVEDRRAPGRYRFTHTLIRQTLYEELNAARRTRLHARIAEAMEALWGTRPGPRVAEIAQHFALAGRHGNLDRAVGYAQQAGDYALRIFAYDEAVRLYGVALEALEALAPEGDEPDAPDAGSIRDVAAAERRCELLLARGEAQHRAGDAAGAKGTFEAAVTLARRLRQAAPASQAATLLARAALGLGSEAATGLVDRGLIELLEEALGGIGGEPSALRARLLAQLAFSYYWAEGPARSGDISREALAVARQAGDPTALAFALTSWHWVLSSEASPEERAAAATEIIDIALGAGDKRAALEGLSLRIADFMELGNVASADRDLATYAEFAESLRRPQFLWYAAALRAMRAHVAGDFAEADRLLQQCLQIGARTQHQDVMGVYAIQLFALRREQGRLRELEGFFLTQMMQYAAMPILRAALADLHLNLGREDDARREFERLAVNDFADLPVDLNWLPGIVILSEVCAALGDGRAAATLYRMLRPFAGRSIVLGYALVCLGSASRPLGLLAATMARAEREGRMAPQDDGEAPGPPAGWAEAERHFEDALTTHAATEARPWLAHTWHDYAAMLAARAGPGDRERARAYVAGALALARELGMGRLVERTESLQASMMERA